MSRRVLRAPVAELEGMFGLRLIFLWKKRKKDLKVSCDWSEGCLAALVDASWTW